MKILMVLDRVFPPDIRVEKEARSLTQAGNNVFVLSQYKTGMNNVEEDIGLATVLRKVPHQSVAGGVFRLCSLSLRGVDTLWQKHVADAVSQYHIDVVHVHDLPLVNTALQVARKHGIPLVADMHENYPEAVRFYTPSDWRGRVTNLILPSRRWEVFERSWLQRSDRVIAVVDEMKDRLITDCGVVPGNVTVVMNLEDSDAFRSMPLREDIIKKYERYFMMCYIGGFGKHRGLQTAIAAMPEILSQVPNALLVLVGSGGNEAELREMVGSMELCNAVEFTGQQPSDLAPSFIAASKVCLVPYIDSVQTNASSPHKLFQYLAMTRPVVVSSMKSLRRIIEETGGGLVFKAEDPGSLGKAVIRLYKDEGLRLRMGRSGATAASDKYDWKQHGRRLTKLYRELEASARAQVTDTAVCRSGKDAGFQSEKGRGYRPAGRL